MDQDSRVSSRLFDYNPEYTEWGEGEDILPKDIPVLVNANSSKITHWKEKPMANHFEYYKL